MTKRFLFIFSLLFFFSVSLSADMLLKDKLKEASTGNYVVTEQNKTYTFLLVREKSQNKISFEQVVIPASRFARQKTDWKSWFERGAPGNTGWIAYQIDLTSGQLDEAFSYTHQGWIQGGEADQFLYTLLNLSFKPVPTQDRRRIGLPPGYGKQDHRPLWAPKLVVEGVPLAPINFSVWKARWPSDGSELSRKNIEVYLPDLQSDTYPIPTFFPSWLEVEGKIGSAKIRVVDCGVGALSPRPRSPHRPPQLMGTTHFDETGLSFKLQAPAYFKDFILMAEPLEDFSKTMEMLPCEIDRNGEEVSFKSSLDTLNEHLEVGQDYRLTIYPVDDPHLCIEISPRLSFAKEWR